MGGGSGRRSEEFMITYVVRHSTHVERRWCPAACVDMMNRSPIADADPIGLDDPISGRDSRPAALVRRPFSNPRPEPMTATQDRNSRPLHCNMVFILGRLIHFSNLSLYSYHVFQ